MSDHYNPSPNRPTTLMDILHNVKKNMPSINGDNGVPCECFNCMNVNIVDADMSDSISTCTTPELITYNPPMVLGNSPMPMNPQMAPGNSPVYMYTNYQIGENYRMAENYRMTMNPQPAVGFSQMLMDSPIPKFLYTDIPDTGKKWCIAGMNCSENSPKHAAIYYHIAICELGSKCQNYSYWHVPMHSGV